ncbi:hypothetical protein DFH07DRAFT_951773 [Mycena maculata]|uniref:Uncharacterized protein n=1 Tax=Mycena maculata TaxID=230809 RepID=A0AAD7K219_9AGAR|nr:hypothetical protein DFH07DRAFT_951773 [Mycena maculata]
MSAIRPAKWGDFCLPLLSYTLLLPPFLAPSVYMDGTLLFNPTPSGPHQSSSMPSNFSCAPSPPPPSLPHKSWLPSAASFPLGQPGAPLQPSSLPFSQASGLPLSPVLDVLPPHPVRRSRAAPCPLGPFRYAALFSS